MTLDATQIKTVRQELFTAVLGDVLDALGYNRQFLPPDIVPLKREMMLVGRAMPVLEADAYDDSQPFGKMFEALDDMKAGEIYVATGGSQTYSLWGELMTTAALNRGAVGAVMHGYLRDTKAILEMNFPAFAIGSYAQDQRVRGRVIDYRCPLEIGGVRINPGDLMVGDLDGILVIPQEVEDEVVEKALAKARTENELKNALLAGMSATEAFAKFGLF